MTGYTVPAQFLPRVRLGEPLSRHTSWHVGGPADIFFMPESRADLVAFLKQLPPDVLSAALPAGGGSANDHVPAPVAGKAPRPRRRRRRPGADKSGSV